MTTIKTLLRTMTAGALLGLTALGANAQTLWQGPPIEFVRPADGSAPTLPSNQDRITDYVWLTRDNTAGLFNIAQQPAYAPGAPLGTAWARGSIADGIQNLVFTDWRTAVLNNPPEAAAAQQPLVVHLLDDDIYLDLQFTAWQAGPFGGGFSYIRSTPSPVPLPAGIWLLGAGVVALRGLMKRRQLPLGQMSVSQQV
ncbi:MAG: hypothetical protein H6978_04510 [Gammaproteobacteria bacterium]|nr:hypothetical protein [Gammaproteobacteria bacterium]